MDKPKKLKQKIYKLEILFKYMQNKEYLLILLYCQHQNIQDPFLSKRINLMDKLIGKLEEPSGQHIIL
jgi:hypothetical protein